MNNQIKSAIILIDNLLNDPKKFGRQSLSDRLEEKDLPHTPSAITRLLKFIYYEIGISIKVDRSKFIYKIDEEETEPNFVEQYHQYKNPYFRSLLHKSSIENKIIGQYLSFGFATNNKNIEFINPLLNAILENRKVKVENCIVADFDKSTEELKVHSSTMDKPITEKQKERLRNGLKEWGDNQSGLKYYLFDEDNFFETDFCKRSKGGVQGVRYKDLRGYLENEQLKDKTTKEISNLLRGKDWY